MYNGAAQRESSGLAATQQAHLVLSLSVVKSMSTLQYLTGKDPIDSSLLLNGPVHSGWVWGFPSIILHALRVKWESEGQMVHYNRGESNGSSPYFV